MFNLKSLICMFSPKGHKGTFQQDNEFFGFKCSRCKFKHQIRIEDLPEVFMKIIDEMDMQEGYVNDHQ